MARLLTDEDFPRAVALRLSALGHDVLTLPEAGLANIGTVDRAVLDYAIEQRRAVVTHNRQHFKRLHRETPLHAGIVACTRDDDHESLARRIHETLESEPSLHAVLVRVTKGGWSRSSDRRDELMRSLRIVWAFADNSRYDFECLNAYRFRVTEVAPDLTVGQRINAYVHKSGRIVSTREPDLTLAQAAVYDAVLDGFAHAILVAESERAIKFRPLDAGEWPELFAPLDTAPSIAGCVRSGMLEVWHALEDLLTDHGYAPVLMRTGASGAPPEVWAERRTPVSQ